MKCCQTCLRCVFQNFILRVQETFLRKIILKFDDFLAIFVPWANNFGHLRENFLWRLTNKLLYGFRKRNSRVLGNKLRIFLGKVSVFQSSQYFDQIFFCFREKNLRSGLSKFHSASPDEGFEDFVFEKTMIFCNLCTLSGKVSHFCKTFTACFSKPQFTCPGKHFAKSFLCKTDGIIRSSFFERKNFRRWLKVYDKGFKTITYMSRETIWETFFKKSLFSNRFCNLSKIFFHFGQTKVGRGCQNYIRRVQRKNVRIFHWNKNDFSYLFAFWAKTLLTSAKQLRQGFRNFNLRVRRKILREKKMKKDDFLEIL